jgi:hypothetical protein
MGMVAEVGTHKRSCLHCGMSEFKQSLCVSGNDSETSALDSHGNEY